MYALRIKLAVFFGLTCWLAATGCLLGDLGPGPSDDERLRTEQRDGSDPNDPPEDNKDDCQSEDDCPTWACYCDEGPPVNSRSCRNGTCAHPEVFCGEFCGAFGTSWTGEYSYVADPENGSGGDGGGGGGGGGSGGGGGGGGGVDCSAAFASNSCGDCGEDHCCAEGAACANDYDCANIASCVVACVNEGASLSYCEGYCTDYFAGGASLYWSYDFCMNSYCWSECH